MKTVMDDLVKKKINTEINNQKENSTNAFWEGIVLFSGLHYMWV